MKRQIIPYIVSLTIAIIFGFNDSFVQQSPDIVKPLSTEDQLVINKLIHPYITYNLADEIDNYCNNTGFNGTVLVAYKNDIVYCNAFGYADLYDKSKILEINTPFQLASTSKQFTAHAIMKLKHDGLIDYDSTVSHYIPDFKYKDITIRQLLNHTSGLYNYMYILDNHYNKTRTNLNNKELIKLMSESDELPYYKPGYKFDYSNTGYAVLATIVEYVTDMSFGDYLKETFFIPLNMHNTYVKVSDNEHYSMEAKGFYRYKGRYYHINKSVHDNIVGDKGVYSTVEDMYKWDQAMIQGTIIPKEVLKEAYQPAKTINDKKVNYGFGYRLKDDETHNIVFHNGTWEGYRIAFYKLPDIESMIIIMNNTCFNVIPLSQKIQSLLYNYNIDNKNTKFLVKAITNDNLNVAQYALYQAISNKSINNKQISDIKQYLWEQKHFKYYNCLEQISYHDNFGR